MGEPARREGNDSESSIMGEPMRRGGGDSFLSGLFVTLLDSESLTDRRIRDVFKPVGGPNRGFELALDERTTFGTAFGT